MLDRILKVWEIEGRYYREEKDLKSIWEELKQFIAQGNWELSDKHLGSSASLYRASVSSDEGHDIFLIDGCVWLSDKRIYFFKEIRDALMFWKQYIHPSIEIVHRTDRTFEEGDKVKLTTDGISLVSSKHPEYSDTTKAFPIWVLDPLTNKHGIKLNEEHIFKIEQKHLILVEPNHERHNITDQAEYLHKALEEKKEDITLEAIIKKRKASSQRY